MLGQRVSGYEVREVLGEGQHGTLYLAVNPGTGHRAAIRVLSSTDTGAAFQPFAREVADALRLPRIPEVEPRKLDDGREVLLALVDPDAPGSGATRFPETTRLERPPRPTRRKWLPALLLLLALFLLGLGWWRRQPQPIELEAALPPAPVEVTPVTPTPLPPAPGLAEEPTPKPAATAKAEPAATAKAEPTPEAKPVARLAPTTKITVTPPPPCEVDARWKANRLADLAEIQERVIRSDALSLELQPRLDQLSVRIRDARNGPECTQVEADLKALIARVLPR